MFIYNILNTKCNHWTTSFGNYTLKERISSGHGNMSPYESILWKRKAHKPVDVPFLNIQTWCRGEKLSNPPTKHTLQHWVFLGWVLLGVLGWVLQPRGEFSFSLGWVLLPPGWVLLFSGVSSPTPGVSSPFLRWGEFVLGWVLLIPSLPPHISDHLSRPQRTLM